MLYFYDNQIKNWMLQFARIFTEIDVTYGKDPAGNPILHRVPVMYGDGSRQVDTIIAKNSASNLPSAPMIVYYMNGIEYDQSRTLDPTFIGKTTVRQRYFNQETGEYETTQGNAFNLERTMPVPYTLRMTVDIWTTNTQQKLEIFEQLGALFNPSIELQSNDNFYDWGSLSVVYQDGISTSSRTIPQGTGNPIDIFSWKFYIPIWISSPYRVKKLNFIQKIIQTIYTGKALSDINDNDLLNGTRTKITPYGYKFLLLNSTLQVLPADAPFVPPNDSFDVPTIQPACIEWQSFLNAYGIIQPGISMVALENPYISTEILGTIEFDPDNASLLIYNLIEDTLPVNTLVAVTSIIDPIMKQPGNGLPAAAAGQRYLIVDSIPEQITYTIGSAPNAWPGLTDGAYEGSIIEFVAGAWTVSFNSRATPASQQFVNNLTTNIQYRFDPIELSWAKSIDGYYPAGNFRIII